MSTLAASTPVHKERPVRMATAVRLTDSMIYIVLADGREIGTPLSRFPWLEHAAPAQRENWRIEPRGFAVYWDDLDDGIEVDHLME